MRGNFRPEPVVIFTEIRIEEWQCLIRTREERFAEVESEVRKLHSYELPGIVALPIVAGSQQYLDWMESETSGAETGRNLS